MRRIIFLRFAGRDIHIPKLIGAFILVAAFLMFLSAGAWMFESWENITNVKDCLTAAALEPSFISSCQAAAKDSLNIYVRPDQTSLALKQISMGLLPPISTTFFWLALLLAGVLFYRSGSIVVPIEETIRELRERRPVRKKKKRRK
jgi:hypothetical protein